VVLPIDEKSQIQPRQQAPAPSPEEPMSGDIGGALDRTQPGLPMKRGRLATVTHDYKRNGTTTLFAALNALDGTVIGQNRQRHRHQEFIQFLNAIERQVPVDKQIHVVLDKSMVSRPSIPRRDAGVGRKPTTGAAHKHAKVKAWFARQPRWTFHFTPTSCSLQGLLALSLSGIG
jgi:hypothetical protein